METSTTLKYKEWQWCYYRNKLILGNLLNSEGIKKTSNKMQHIFTKALTKTNRIFS